MDDHPEDERLDEEHAALTKSTRRRQRTSAVELSLVTGAAFLIAVSTMFSAWNSFELRRLAHREADTRQVILLGTECLVEQLSQHRHLNAVSHRADANHHDFPYPIPPEQEPPPIPGELERSCALFISTTTSRPR